MRSDPGQSKVITSKLVGERGCQESLCWSDLM